MRLAVFGFRGTNSEIIAGRLASTTGADVATLLGTGSIKTFRRWLISTQPTHILGLGRYTGRDRDHLRLETVCTSIFGRAIKPHLELAMDPWLDPDQQIKLARGIGNSYCNAVSWAISTAIQDGLLSAQYSFVHVPAEFDLDRASKHLLDRIAATSKLLPSVL